MFTVDAQKYDKIKVSITAEEVLKVIQRAYSSKFRRSLDIKVKDGWVMKYECTSYHNNDWEWERSHVATEAEIEQYAFWCQIKEIFEEK